MTGSDGEPNGTGADFAATYREAKRAAEDAEIERDRLAGELDELRQGS